MDDRHRGPDRQIVPVEGDVDVAERHRRVEQLAGQRVQPLAQYRAAPVDADKRNLSIRILLDDLVGDPHERAAHVIAVQSDRYGVQLAPSWPHGTGLKGRATWWRGA